MIRKRAINARISMIIVFFFMLSLFLPVLPEEKTVVAEENDGPLLIGDLKVGDKVVDKSWAWEYRTGNNYTGSGTVRHVTWIVVAKNHYIGGSAGSVAGGEDHVTLFSDGVIAKHAFDNSTNRGSEWGSNHWGNTGTTDAENGLRKFLNGSSYAGSDTNNYEVTFYDAMSAFFRDAILTTSLPNRVWNTGSSYTTYDNIFLPSTTEMGDIEHTSTHMIGSDWGFFNNRKSMIASLNGRNWYYWLRSPDLHNPNRVTGISSNGTFYFNRADFSECAVRPAVNVSADVLISGQTEEGVYILQEREQTATPLLTTPAQTVTTDTITVEGSAEPNAAIVITGGAATVTGAANAAGNFSIEVNLIQNAVNRLSVTAQSAGKIESEAATVAITHKFRTATPFILTEPQIVTTDTIAVEGSAEANASIVITGGATIATGEADAAGNFSVEVTLTRNATNHLSVTAHSAGKLVSYAATVFIAHEAEEEPEIPVSGISLNKEEVSLFAGGADAILVPEFTPDDATNKRIIWTSDNEDVVKVTTVSVADTSFAVIEPVSEGMATVTATTEDGSFQATCSVTVVVAPNGVFMSHSELDMHAHSEFMLQATVVPENATNKNVIWYSSDPDIVTVDSNGKVTAHSAGVAYVYVKTEEREIRERCIVIVTERVVDEIRRGHVLGNETITVGDAIAVLRHITGLDILDENARERARVSKRDNDTITVKDAILILRYIVGLTEQWDQA